ncbi:hypothetical protein Clacol_003147 [Clathrus columnatus]|uniref:Uncharacterized protein n=1 Tax=Clathrus columnatus TaxID=1419009 RepID=A0AAV5A2R6_9AGAM|nr:hypothetical protein Clacol_003147 [Clathrus columnatus]
MFSTRSLVVIVTLNAVLLYPSISNFIQKSQSRTYSYVGNDYPMRVPLDLGTAEMTFDCSAQYDINSSFSGEIWSKSMDTRSGGFVRLGDDYRVFAVSMYHQLHCMGALQHSLAQADGKPSPMDVHIQHCLNYLRQFILCSADGTQEPPVKVADLKTQGCAPPYRRQCRNWNKLYHFSAINYLDFHEYKVNNGSWTCHNPVGQDSTSKETPQNLSMMALNSLCED